MAQSVQEAAREFWSKQRHTTDAVNGTAHTGRLSSQVSNSHWTQIVEALVGAFAERGVDPAWVRFEGGPVLPAMYGVGSRAWDLVVVKDDLPLAAVTFAAMSGMSIGNNLNNRVHQLMSIAHDVRAAYAGPEQSRIQPYLGAFFVLEDTDRVNTPLSKRAHDYQGLDNWHTYKERLGETFKQFRNEELYDGIAYIACGSEEGLALEEPYLELSIDGFVGSLVEHVLRLDETLRLEGFTPESYQALLTRRPGADSSATPDGKADGQQASEATGSAAREPAPDPRLLFRAYIPADRLYSAEMETFLSLFRGWASAVRGHTIRQGGYETAAGKVFEFYVDDAAEGVDFVRERADFSAFLALCASDPAAAADRLVEDGLARPQAAAFAARYTKQLRRLNLDLRQERERRILDLTHDIEASLLDLGEEPDAVPDQVRAVLDILVPDVSAKTYQGLLGTGRERNHAGIDITVNQFIGKVEGIVAASVSGEASIGLQAKELLALIDAYGGDTADALRSAVFEVEDKDAPSAKRRDAKQRLKMFLVQVGKFTREVGIDLLERTFRGRVTVLS